MKRPEQHVLVMNYYYKNFVMEGECPEGNPSISASSPLPLQPDAPTACDAITVPEYPAENTGMRMGPPTKNQSTVGGTPAYSPRGVTGAPSSRLCGYLHKLGGPLKSWKSRWFTCEEKKCQLFYYRTSQDVNPLGQIQLANATFGYPLKADEGIFHIQTPERTFVLKAVNRETMMYWLQQLQLKRRQHREGSAGDLEKFRVTTQPCRDAETEGGLEKFRVTTQPCRDAETDGVLGALACSAGNEDFLPTVKTPAGLVGVGAAETAATQLRGLLRNVSFKHPLTEIQNSVHSLRQSHSFQDLGQNVIHWEELLEVPPLSTSDPETSSVPETPDSPAPRRLEERMSPCTPRSPSQSVRSRKKKKTTGDLPAMPVDPRRVFLADRSLRLQQEVLSLTEEVKAQKELVWLLHKALEAAQQEKRTCAEFLSAEGEQERLELVRHRERHVAKLLAELEALRGQQGALQQSLAQRDAQVTELQEHLQLMMEKNGAKQEVILKLSAQVATCAADSQRTVPNGTSAETFLEWREEMENLKDDIEAYKLQNKFLNSEIYQLTKLWRKSSEQEKSLVMKCVYLEAKNCQVESRYLGMLRKLQENKGLDSGHMEVVKKLIEEALQGNAKDGLKLDPISEHDEYGFKIIPDYEVEDMKLLAKIQALEIRSHNLLQQEAADRPLLSRWAQYLGGRPSGELVASPELKGLLRGGVPAEYRPQVWRWVIWARTRSLRQRHPQRYQVLCSKGEASQHPASRQIQLDLHRTLTSNQHFSSPSNPAVKQLHRILLAFSWQNPTIGYCQGLNRLAAIALLVLQNEEEAFWCLVAVVEAIMPQDYYSKTLIASQADQRVLKDFMAEKMPRLMAHLEEHSVDVSLVTFNWFIVVFVESLASDILLRIWDAFLYEGTKVIFRYAMALFKYKEEDILKIHDNVEIYQYLRFFTKTVSDGRKLTNIAFNDMNPFPKKLLQNRRTQHLERLRAELQELEQTQQEFVTESAEHQDKDLAQAGSEDEEDA